MEVILPVLVPLRAWLVARQIAGSKSLSPFPAAGVREQCGGWCRPAQTVRKTLKATTIDAILAKSDLELGLEVLTDRSLFPHDPPWRTQP